jgi:uncharacterized repeat protein (TIGR01451 family)
MADLSLTKTDSPDPVLAGQNITYTDTVANAGPDDAVNVSVSDSTPANTTFVSASAPAGWSTTAPAPGGTGAITFTRATLTSGDGPQVFTIVVNVNAATPNGTVITNSASVTSGTADTNSNNNSQNTTTTVVVPTADLTLSKSDSPDPVLAGQNITYTIDVQNFGPNTAVNAVVSDTLPPNTTFVSASAPAGWSTMAPSPGGTGTVTFTNSSFGSNEVPDTFTIVVQVNGAAPDGTVISNTASVTSNTSDPNANNNSQTTTTTVSNPPPAQADLSVTKTAPVTTALAGDNVTYTITVSNAGPATALSAFLSDTLPAHTTFQSLSAPPGWSCETPPVGGTGSIDCSTQTLPSGSQAVFTLVVHVDDSTFVGTNIANTATVSSQGSPDPNTDNNSATFTIQVQAAPAAVADLALVKTASPEEVAPGSAITYTLTVTNQGPSDVTNVVVTDQVPANTTFVSATACTGATVTAPNAGGTGTVQATWAGPTSVGEDLTLTIIVQANDGLPDGTTITNTASASGDLPDLDLSNNQATATSTVTNNPNTPMADISITTSSVPSTVDTGTFITYTITVHNNGPDAAEDVVVMGSTPDGTRLVSIDTTQGTVSGTQPGGQGSYTVDIGEIPAGGTVTITVVVNVIAPGGAEVMSSVAVSTSTIDPVANNNASISETTRVIAGNDTLLTWDPPLPCADNCLNPPLHLQTSAPPPTKGLPSFTGQGGVNVLRNTVIGYNIYRSNDPNVQPTPENFFTSVPPSVTSLVAPTAPGGSFFTVTAVYPNGESGQTNAASGGLPEPIITGFQIRGNKVVVIGTGFTDDVQVFIDGIPFKKDAKVKAADGKVVQKGKLLTGQRVSQYLQQQGGVILVSVLNTDSGIGTFLFRQ